MTNAEKYLKGITPYEFAREYGLYYYNYERGMYGSPADKIGRFLKAEVKPTLTEDERVILKNMENATHIKRDNGIKYIDKDEYIRTYYELPYSHLFQFIKERRRI